MKTPNLKTFAGWTSLDVENYLNYQSALVLPQLYDRITVQGEINPKWQEYIEDRRLELIRFQNVWNETDLLSYFIGPLLTTIAFHGVGFNHFSERTIEAQIGKFNVHGVVDLMIASGSAEPEVPFFFLHEYKRMKGTEADPLGQLLIEMVAVQKLNQWTDEPIYGCYVIGTYWRFVLLTGKTYSISEGFDATKVEELKQIWLILNKTKEIIAEKALVLWNQKMEAFRS